MGGWASLESRVRNVSACHRIPGHRERCSHLPRRGGSGKRTPSAQPARMEALQPQTGCPDQAEVWCLGLGAGIALVVQVLSRGSQVAVGDLVPATVEACSTRSARWSSAGCCSWEGTQESVCSRHGYRVEQQACSVLQIMRRRLKSTTMQRRERVETCVLR